MHYTVLKEETVNSVVTNKNGIYIDGTFGRGGHTELLLNKLEDDGIIIAIDQDQEAIDYGKNKIKDSRLKLNKSNFSNFEEILNKYNIEKIDGLILDLGFSSPQIDDPKRGFSYMHNGLLDMRMDQNQSLCAKDIINTYSEQELIRIFKEYGEEKFSKYIARNIVKERQNNEITQTLELVNIIEKAIPKKFLVKIKGHTAKKVFQALRIEVNQELKVLVMILNKAFSRLNSGGRIAIITFHSLEDKIVKNFYKKVAELPEELKKLPEVPKDYKVQAKIITNKPILPSEDELIQNSRSKSAKLRVLEKI